MHVVYNSYTEGFILGDSFGEDFGVQVYKSDLIALRFPQ